MQHENVSKCPRGSCGVCTAHLLIPHPRARRELSHFIAAKRLNCKIDKVAGIVMTNRLDMKNAQYQTVIKQGDLLLNQVQKLSQAINI